MNRKIYRVWNDGPNQPERPITDIICDCGNTLMVADIKYRFAPVTIDGHVLQFGKWERDTAYFKQSEPGKVVFCPKCGKEYGKYSDYTDIHVSDIKKEKEEKEKERTEVTEEIEKCDTIIKGLKDAEPHLNSKDIYDYDKVPQGVVEDTIRLLGSYRDWLGKYYSKL